MLDSDYFLLWDGYQLGYVLLKQQFIEISSSQISSICLEQLKNTYDSIIRSKRDADSIDNISALLKILEDRTALKYDQVGTLKHIASEIVKNNILHKIIHKYEIDIQRHQTHSSLLLFNIYKSRHMLVTSPNPVICKAFQKQKDKAHNANIHVCSLSHHIPQLPLRQAFTSITEQQKRAFVKLSKDMDRYWRDLARFLDITESEIEEIDRKAHFQLRDKAFKILEMFAERADPSTWQSKLIQSLNSVRRKDLVKLIDKSFSK